jgi:hypothetical protein
MGTVERPEFGRKRSILTGFIPANLGQDALEKSRAKQAEQDRQISLINFAKQGSPTPPDDCP